MKLFIFFISLSLNSLIFTSNVEEKRIDFREMAKNKEEMDALIHYTQLNHKFNQAVTYTPEWYALTKELYHNQIG